MKKTFLLTLSGLALLSGFNSVQAQRERAPREERRETFRQQMENMTPEQRQQFRQQRMQERMRNMTPEQRAQFQARMQEWQQNGGEAGGQGGGRGERNAELRWDWIRQTLVASGYTDATMQNSVIDFMKAQETARQPLREQAQALTVLLVNPATPDADLQTGLAAFRTAVAADQARYTTELAALDTSVKYSTQPRLETLLTVLGVVGQEAPTLGGVGALFPESPMGTGGGRGNRGRGNRGGGQGGGNRGGGAQGGPEAPVEAPAPQPAQQLNE
jgi:hypothetical protein